MGPRTHTERLERAKGRRHLIGVALVMVWMVAVFTLLAQAASGQEPIARFVPFAQCEGACNPGGRQIIDEGPQLHPVVQQPAQQSSALYVVRIHCPLGGGFANYGSGAIIESSESESLVVTCRHVVEESVQRRRSDCSIQLVDGRSLPGQIVAMAQDCDAALIVVATGGLTPIPLAESDQQGGTAIVGGFGGEWQFRAARGGIGRYVRDTRGWPLFWLGVGVRSGDSGGPVVSEQGQLVGIVWGSINGESTCTPVSSIRALVQSVRVQLAGRFCQGNQCQPRPPQQPPAQPPSNLEARIAALEQKLANLKTIEGPPGRDGKDGKDGRDATVDIDALAQQVSLSLAPLAAELEQRIAAQEAREMTLEIFREGQRVGSSTGKRIVRFDVEQLVTTPQGK